MSPNRPSKDKRAAQNRSQRAAREARKLNAQAAPSSGRAESAPSAGAGGLLSRLRRGGSSAPRPAPRDVPARQSMAAARALQPPGYRAALSAVLAAGAALALCIFGLRYPVDARGDIYSAETLVADWTTAALRTAGDEPDVASGELVDSVEDWTPGRSRETVAVALWPISLTLVLPLAGAGLGLRSVRRRAPSKVVNRALYATLFGAILTQGLLLLFLPVVLAMGVAMFQVRKAETAAAASAAAAAAGSDGVIDVQEAQSADAEPGESPTGEESSER